MGCLHNNTEIALTKLRIRIQYHLLQKVTLMLYYSTDFVHYA